MIALVACQQNKHDRPAPVPPIEVVVAGDAVTAAKPIDLFVSVPTTIVVSSRVANGAIRPRHLVDRDLETAWNSITGELVGAWIEIKIPAATITELRMTVGHTGHGPKGEDYFTMNPRIRAVAVTVDDKPAGTFKLDVDNRALQPLAIHATGVVRVTVTDIAMGSKESWRETAISELQAWGTPPPGWKAPPRPLVPVVTVADAPTASELDPCYGADAERDAFIKEHAHDVYSGPGGEDHSYPPRCEPMDVPEVPPMWSRHGAGCNVGDEIYGPKTCTVMFALGAAHAGVTVTEEFASADVSVTSITELPSMSGIAVRFKTPHGDKLGVCRSAPLGCTEPIQITGDDWVTREHFAGAAMVLEAVSGTPPAGVLGSHALFP
jgi:hypothetical protein